jgi:hypothetical protein
MKLHIVTICLDAMPTLPALFFNFNRLNLDWTWHISEGAAANVNCTKWCQAQDARFSEDGTHEFLMMIAKHPRVKIHCKKWWDGGKVQMINDPLANIRDEDHSVLLQCDADEIWQSWQLERIVEAFEKDAFAGSAQFRCRYFVGLDIISNTFGSYGNNSWEWLRAWRFTPGDRFEAHEPPKLRQQYQGHRINPDWFSAEGVAFDHYSWAFENQVRYKEFFYGYHGAHEHWLRLQANTVWPVKRLKDFLPWVDERATAVKLPLTTASTLGYNVPQ